MGWSVGGSVCESVGLCGSVGLRAGANAGMDMSVISGVRGCVHKKVSAGLTVGVSVGAGPYGCCSH